MPCSSRLVMHRMCGRFFFSMPEKQSCRWASSSSFFACLRRWSIAQVRKPPVPQAGSSTVSRSAMPGLTCSTMNSVTARGV